MESYSDRTIKGINYNFLNMLGKTLLQFLVGVVLARLIPPADFGLLGMAFIFIGLANLFSTLGMGAAVIQRTNLTQEHIRIATTLSLLLSIFIYFSFWFLSPFIAAFFNESRIVPIIRVISVLFIFQGLYSISRGLVVRKLDFKSVFYIETISFIIGQGIVSIILAILGYGVWSLVLGRVLTGALSFILFIFKVRLPIKPLFKRKEAYELFSFGSGVSLIAILNYGATNVDYLVIGKFLTPYSLGLYTRAFNLMTLPLSQISQSISGVLFSAYSEIQNDIERLKRSYIKAVSIIGFLAFPILAGMITCGYYIIVGLYGKNWAGAVNVFRILTVSAFFKVIYNIAGSVTQATANVYSEAWRQFVYFIILGTGVLFGVRYGIEGVGAAAIVASLWLYISMANLVTRIIGIKVKEFYKAQLPGLIIAFIVFIFDQAAILLLNNYYNNLNESIKLAILILVSSIAVLLSFVYLPKKIKGDTPEWVINKYKTFIPNRFLRRKTQFASIK